MRSRREAQIGHRSPRRVRRIRHDPVDRQGDGESDPRSPEFVGAGFIDQILLSHDLCVVSQLGAHHGPAYAFILTQFVPASSKRGYDNRTWTES